MLPESLKTNKEIAPYYARYRELEEINPIVSYYCKIRILDIILNNKLHVEDKAIESYVIELLNETESLKNQQDDDSISKILHDKNLSINLVLSFALKVYNQCLTDLNNYDGTNKPQLVSKFKACLNFLGLMTIFQNDEIDWGKLTGGKSTTYSEFEAVNRDRIKMLKYNLSKLIKDEIQIKGEEEELAALGVEGGETGVGDTDQVDNIEDGDKDYKGDGDKDDIEENNKEIKSNPFLPDTPPNLPNTPPKLPETPQNEPSTNLPKPPTSNPTPAPTTDSPTVDLPGAPHFDPSDSEDLKLPGAPKFLPDDDLSKINKDSSITVIPPGKSRTSSHSGPTHAGPPHAAPKPEVPKHEVAKREVPKPHHKPITKASLELILDKQETVTKIQKLCKFAISALNYEDYTTAEKELSEGLELLRVLKEMKD